MSRQSIARDIAGRWGLAGSSNLVLWGLLAVLIALFIGIAGGWWNGSKLAKGKQAINENVVLIKTITQANDVIVRQQKVVAESSRQLELTAKRQAAIAEETAREREFNRQQMALIRGQMEDALAARPDLAGVRVGNGVRDAWNAANRGNATGAAGAAQPATKVRPGAAPARAGSAAGTERR